MNNKKGIFIQLLIILCFSVGLGYSLVFAGITGKIEFKTSDNIFIDSLNLHTSRIYMSSSDDITDIAVSGDCSPKLRFIEKKDKLFVFDVSFTDKLCEESKAKIYFQKGDLRLSTSFNIFSDFGLYSQYLDYSDEELEKYLQGMKTTQKRFIKYKISYNPTLHINYIDYITNARKLEEIIFIEDFISNILTKREQKYLIPVKGVKMPTQSTRLPNSGRPYRASYTDGIHEGWDFYTDFGNVVQALDYGIVVRVIGNFTYSDLGKIKETGELTELDKLKNLDILRGNQVWIKTMKGDVAFYAHLNEVFDNVKVGDIVFRGQALGTVGISGVPDSDYSDYHLHLEIHKNLYLKHKNPYTYEDYMSWDWYFKGEKEKYILENQYNIFEEN